MQLYRWRSDIIAEKGPTSELQNRSFIAKLKIAKSQIWRWLNFVIWECLPPQYPPYEGNSKQNNNQKYNTLRQNSTKSKNEVDYDTHVTTSIEYGNESMYNNPKVIMEQRGETMIEESVFKSTPIAIEFNPKKDFCHF